MLFLVRIRVENKQELADAILAIHGEYPRLMFTFVCAITGTTRIEPFTEYSEARFTSFSEYIFYTVSEMSQEFTRSFLNPSVSKILEDRGIKVID